MRLLLCVISILAFGCRSIDLQQTTPRAQYQRTSRNVLDGGDASEFTLNLLRRRNLTGKHRTDPVGTMDKLEKEMRASHDRTLCIAIAELAVLQSNRVNTPDPRALATTLRYSYAYLFDPKLMPAPDPYDARFRMACDLYNFALAGIVRLLPEDIRHKRKSWPVEWYGGRSAVRIGENDFPGSAGVVERMRIAADYIVTGLEPPALRQGIGVPCLLHRPTHQGTSDAARRAKKNPYLPATSSIGATVLMRWPADASILDPTQAGGTFELLDPMDTISVAIGDRDVPLEVDFTTPIAEMAVEYPDEGGLSALFHPGEHASRIGLYMFQPFRADRLTVLLVHGLASGPETWLPMYNELLNDTTIRTRCQFVFWFYPTGPPALTSAYKLRQALKDAHHAYGGTSSVEDGTGVFVCAHSLGGILASTLVVDSGDVLWDTAFTVPPERLPIPEEERARLVAALRFEALPYIGRVVYYSTPHRGAPEANTGFMQWASRLIKLPRQLFGKNAGLRRYMREDVRFDSYTVAQSLIAHNPMMEALANLQATTRVPFHSIIGNNVEAGVKGGTDGFVPYWSSHLDGARSELVIHSDHSTLLKPAAARETRRILLDYLASLPNPAR